jgi:predicted aspartyl protease/cytochrome c-type biogenesis protein CcmH/NrfG
MRYSSLALLPLAAIFSSTAQAQCQLAKYLELPVTMRGTRPIVSAQIGGKDAQFILDSGAFFSMLSRASAQAYGLRLDALPPGFELRGINGSTSAFLTTARTFGLGGVTLPDIQFIVGGTDTGQVGLLGQNFLSIGDVEYDLRHGAVRLLRAQGCKVDDLAYWAGSSPVTIIPLEDRTPHHNRTVATVMLNGVKLRALFDTGAPSSVLTLSAAKRAGVTPTSPGVVASGISTGIGSRSLRTWTASFRRLEIGGESIPNPKIRLSEAQFNDADMLIGADFFLTHHIYVANQAGKMLITYEGGTVFGVTSTGASDGEGKPLDLTDRTAEPTDAEGFSRRGAARASTRQFDAAIADFDRAIALAPNQTRYLRQRAAARLANTQPLLAAADLDKALAVDPADVEARQMRAGLRLVAHDPNGAAEDIRVLDQQLPASSGQRLQLAAMADGAGLPEIALANDDAWLKTHPEDAQRPAALNTRCWVRAQLNRDLKAALDDCNAALRARPGSAAYLDSRALVRLRQGDLAGALADYDAALRLQPRNPWSLYMRGVVKRRAGDASGAEADRKAALALAPRVFERAAKLGLDN